MPSEVKLRLKLTDVYGSPIKEKVDILLKHQVLSENLKVSETGAPQIDILGLRGAPQGLYRIEIDPPSYQYVSQFINMKASGITSLDITFPIDPSKVKKVNLPRLCESAGRPSEAIGEQRQSALVRGQKGKESL